MGNNTSASSGESGAGSRLYQSEAENKSLRAQLRISKRQTRNARDRIDQQIQDARFVTVSTAAIVVLAGAGCAFLGLRRYRLIEAVSRGLTRRLEHHEKESATQVDRLTKSIESSRVAARGTGSASVAKSVKNSMHCYESDNFKRIRASYVRVSWLVARVCVQPPLHFVAPQGHARGRG